MSETIAQTEYVVADTVPTIAEVAADVGNARTVVLVRTITDPTPIAINMPSVRTLHGAFSWRLFADRGLPAASWSALGIGEHIIERDGIERFVGRLAVEHGGAASSGRGSDARYHDGTTLDFILAGVAAALPGASKITVSKLSTMLPISLWHLAPRVEQSLRGSHTLRYNGREVVIQVRAVVVKREAEASFESLDGDTSGAVAIIDAGGRTVNVALFRDGVYRSGATLELGVQAALDNLDLALRGQGHRPLTLAERDDLEAALIADRPYSYIDEGQVVRIDTLARVQLDATARALVQEIGARVPLAQCRRIAFVGGGAHGPLFGDVVRAGLPRVDAGGLHELGNVYGALGAVPVKRGKKR